MDAGNMLKPMLARGELRMVGATTLDEYRKYIEKDAALERRFQQVLVGEPSVEDTVGILRGLKDRYEVHHGVRSPTPRWSRRPRCPTATSPTGSCRTRRST
jgi:ATP-dependent Clp protease ATP-binding subunit ClpB